MPSADILPVLKGSQQTGGEGRVAGPAPRGQAMPGRASKEPGRLGSS